MRVRNNLIYLCNIIFLDFLCLPANKILAQSRLSSHVPFCEILPPSEIVCDEVVVPAAFALDDDDALGVGLLGDELGVAGAAHLARVAELEATGQFGQGNGVSCA